MDKFSWEATWTKNFFSPFWKEVYSKTKEFAPPWEQIYSFQSQTCYRLHTNVFDYNYNYFVISWLQITITITSFLNVINYNYNYIAM